MLKKQDKDTVVIREVVLNVVNKSPVKLSAREISRRSGLTYKQTIDALQALNNYERVVRIGKKFSARWIRVGIVECCNESVKELENVFMSIAKKQSTRRFSKPKPKKITKKR